MSSGSAQAPRSTGNPAPAGAKADANAAGVVAPSARSVYFDYDSNVVKKQFAPLVQSNAGFLAAQPAARATIQGNTDERGSREYNLALGQRRADALKNSLTLLGAPAQQIETVSFGEEKPRDAADNEQAHAANRRADIVYGR